jgi:putative ABC transport system permease protein
MSLAAWRVLTSAQLREQPLRVVATIAAIALGVALGSAVYLVNGAALSEFDVASRRLVGSADLIVRGPPAGFDESLFTTLADDADVQVASPVLELELTLPGENASLKLLGVDVFRAAALQPALLGELAGKVTDLFHRDSVVLTPAAAQARGLQAGGNLSVLAGGRQQTLHVDEVLTQDLYPEPLALMDIATAQWSLGFIGRLNRVDLRLRPGVNVEAYRQRLSVALPPGVVVRTPAIESGRAVNATRAYRVNLNMLAMVALLTGAFLVFSTQSLAVLRRRRAIGLLRSLGVTRAELQRALLAEGAAIGLIGSVAGALLGACLAAVVLRYLGSSLGNRQLTTVSAALSWQPWGLLGFALLGTLAASVGAWLPARESAARPPAQAIRAGDVEPALARATPTLPGLALITFGVAVAWLPPWHGVPVPGYVAIAALLLGSILLIPLLMRLCTRALPRTGLIVVDTAVAQLAGSTSVATVSVACIIVSFSLMVAMAIMVHSFRTSFDLWLIKLLPADLQLRTSAGSGTGSLSAEQQRRLDALPQVTHIQYRRIVPTWLQSDQPPVMLIARDFGGARPADVLPLVTAAAASTVPAPNLPEPVWISEAVVDHYHYHVNQQLTLPLNGRTANFVVAGIWRDYARTEGSIVIDRTAYERLTGDTDATEASLWRRPEASPDELEQAVRSTLQLGDAIELIGSPQLRERSLVLFDRAFAVTYALEVIAVAIGLAGIGVAASSTALSRRSQFGVLRHIGMLRRQILGMLASEGVIMASVSIVYGLLLGLVLSLILVYVINRQSFSWSIDLVIPAGQLIVLSAALIVASALTALWSGRSAMSDDAVRAVREDW